MPNVIALAIDPVTPATLYAGTYVGGVFKSTNGGATWRTADAGLASTTVSALAIDSATPATVYAGTNVRGVVVVRQLDKQVYLPFVVRGQ